MEINEKINLIEQAKKTVETLKEAGVKAVLRMSIRDKVYFTVRRLLQSSDKNKIKLLYAGTKYVKANNTAEPVKENLREQLYNPELTQKTNAVAQQFVKQNEREQQEKSKDITDEKKYEEMEQ